MCTKQILINVKLQIGNSGEKQGRRSTVDCSVIEEDGYEECQWSTNYRCANEWQKEVFSRPPC